MGCLCRIFTVRDYAPLQALGDESGAFYDEHGPFWLEHVDIAIDRWSTFRTHPPGGSGIIFRHYHSMGFPVVPKPWKIVDQIRGSARVCTIDLSGEDSLKKDRSFVWDRCKIDSVERGIVKGFLEHFCVEFVGYFRPIWIK